MDNYIYTRVCIKISIRIYRKLITQVVNDSKVGDKQEKKRIFSNLLFYTYEILKQIHVLYIFLKNF